MENQKALARDIICRSKKLISNGDNDSSDCGEEEEAEVDLVIEDDDQ